jgi:hypothetical protein
VHCALPTRNGKYLWPRRKTVNWLRRFSGQCRATSRSYNEVSRRAAYRAARRPGAAGRQDRQTDRPTVGCTAPDFPLPAGLSVRPDSLAADLLSALRVIPLQTQIGWTHSSETGVGKTNRSDVSLSVVYLFHYDQPFVTQIRAQCSICLLKIQRKMEALLTAYLRYYVSIFFSCGPFGPIFESWLSPFSWFHDHSQTHHNL